MLHPIVKTTITKPPWPPSKNGFDHLVPHVILHLKVGCWHRLPISPLVCTHHKANNNNNNNNNNKVSVTVIKKNGGQCGELRRRKECALFLCFITSEFFNISCKFLYG